MKIKRSGIVFVSLLLFAGILFLVFGCGTGGGGGGSSIPSGALVDIWVSTTGSDETGDGSEGNPYRTVQKGLNEASTGEVVGLKNGTYDVASVNWPVTAEGITLRGESRTGAILSDNDVTYPTIYISDTLPVQQTITIESLTLKDANRSGSTGGSIVSSFSNGNELNLHIKNVLFTNNLAKEGPAIYVSGTSPGSLVVEDSLFYGNRASGSTSKGGAVSMANSNFPGTFINCTFEGNVVEGPDGYSHGGAIISSSGLTVNGCSFINNYAYNDTSGIAQGGAVYSQYNAVIENSTFSGNTAEAHGGAIYMLGDVDLTLTNCTLSSNTAETEAGGGVYLQSNGSLNATGCTFKNNKAGGSGGGGGVRSTNSTQGETQITDCDFIGNRANTGGGAYLYTADVDKCVFKGNSTGANAAAVYLYSGGSVINCLFYDNEADGNTGALFHYASDLDLVNCTVVSNEAPTSPGLFLGGDASRVTNIRNCIIMRNIGTGSQINISGTGITTIEYSDIQGSFPGTGNLNNVDPVFASSEQDEDQDFMLSAGSPASVTEGGTTVEAPSDDLSGIITRTPPYSMGAYEYDSSL